MTQTSQKSFSSGLLLLVVLVELFAFGLWGGGPRVVRGEECVFNISFSAHIGHSINCDSSEFLYASSDLDNVWGPESKWQSRPGSVLFVWLAARPLVFALDLFFDRAESVAFNDIEHGNEVAYTIRRNELIAAYLTFLLLHFLILIVSYKLYMRLAGITPSTRGRLKTAAAVAGLVVFINNITKQFLWSPHTQLFNIMAPLLSVYLFVRMQEAERPEKLFLLTGLLSGMGMLFYGIFILPATVAGLGYLWRRRGVLIAGIGQGQALATGAGAVVLFAVPLAVWYEFIFLKNGAFHDYHVERFRGFVWFAQVWAQDGRGRAIYWLGYNFLEMFRGAFTQGWGFVIVLAGLVWYARRFGKQSEAKADNVHLWVGAGLYAVLAAAFYALYGLIVARLSYTIVAAVFPLIGFYLHYCEHHMSRPLLLKRATMVGVCVYLVFMLAKFGPYS